MHATGGKRPYQWMWDMQLFACLARWQPCNSLNRTVTLLLQPTSNKAALYLGRGGSILQRIPVPALLTQKGPSSLFPLWTSINSVFSWCQLRYTDTSWKSKSLKKKPLGLAFKINVMNGSSLNQMATNTVQTLVIMYGSCFPLFSSPKKPFWSREVLSGNLEILPRPSHPYIYTEQCRW